MGKRGEEVVLLLLVEVRVIRFRACSTALISGELERVGSVRWGYWSCCSALGLVLPDVISRSSSTARSIISISLSLMDSEEEDEDEGGVELRLMVAVWGLCSGCGLNENCVDEIAVGLIEPGNELRDCMSLTASAVDDRLVVMMVMAEMGK